MTAPSTPTASATAAESTAAHPAGRLQGWDCIEFWVGNARSTAGFLLAGFGFSCTGYAGPETGVRDRVSYVLEQGDIRFVVTGALGPDSPIAEHVRLHGDGVHDLAWVVDDVDVAYDAAIARGATSVRAPYVLEGPDPDDDGDDLRLAAIGTYGETQHTFVGRGRYRGPSLAPGYTTEDLLPDPVGPPVGLARIDHVVGNVEKGSLAHWVDFYAQVLGFDSMVHFDDEAISTEYSALMSTVVWDGSTIVMPINEPADGRKKFNRDGLLAHPYMYIGGGDRSQSNGCIVFKNYDRFLAAFKRGKIKKMIVVKSLDELPTYMAAL